LEIAVIAILLLLAFSSLRLIGKFFSFVMSSFIKLIILIILIVVVIIGLDYYGINFSDKFNKTEMTNFLKQHKEEGS